MGQKIIFAGSSAFSIPSLQSLLNSKHHVIAVYTAPDRFAGRGRGLTFTPIKQFAIQKGLSIRQPETLRYQSEQNYISALQADIMIDVAYGTFIPKEILTTFKYGCINVHPSLLPRWRGAAPIQRAILSGDAQTGVTIMQVDEGLDTGDILRQTSIAIENTDTSEILHEKLAKLGADLLVETLDNISNNNIKPIPQNKAQSTYANKITKQEAQIDWKQSAFEIDRLIRAFNSWPVAFSQISDKVIRIWKATPIDETTSEQAGTIIKATKDGIYVATGNGILSILELQLPGGKILPVSELLKARREFLDPGVCFNA